MQDSLIQFASLRLSSIDVQKSSEFYRQLFQIEAKYDEKNFVSFNLGNCSLDISSADPLSPSSTGGSVGYWLVDHLDANLSRALSLVASIYRGPIVVPEIKRTIVQIKDPVGNVMGFEAVIKKESH